MPTAIRALGERVHDRRRHVGEVEDLAAQEQAAGLGARELEQIFDEANHAVDFARDLRQEQRARFGVVVGDQHGFEHQLDRRERRAQLVRDVGHEFAPHVLDREQVGAVGRHGDGAAFERVRA